MRLAYLVGRRRILAGMLMPVTIAVLMLAVMTAVDGRSKETLTVSADGNGNQPGFVPFFTRVGPFGPTIRNDDWVVLYFYYEEPESCVPGGFNLLGMFGPAPAFCSTPSTDGVALPSPGPSPVPKHQSFVGNGNVPVWLVDPAEFDAITADGDLLIGEVEPIALKGIASQFHETLHPGGGANQLMMSTTAHGVTDSGDSFKFSAHYTLFGKKNGASVVKVNIH